jgi:putative redox protein
MADTNIALRWDGVGMQFTAEHASGNHFHLDGNSKTSHSPVQALALSLAGCIGSDVVDISEKMRVSFAGLRVQIEGDRNAEPPRYFTSLRVVVFVKGVAPEDEARVQRALDLSHEKYCSVFHTLRKDLSFSTRLVLE